MRKSWTARAIVLTLVGLVALLAGGGAQAMRNAAPANTTPPSISGTPTVGQPLTADPGSWSGNPTSFVYQWQRCDGDVVVCSNVVGATGKTHGLSVADLGYRLRVAVTAQNAKGSASATPAIP